MHLDLGNLPHVLPRLFPCTPLWVLSGERKGPTMRSSRRERRCFRNPLHQGEDSRVRPPQGTGAGSLEVEKEVEQSPVSALGQQQGAVLHPDCGISPTTRKEQDNWKILPLDSGTNPHEHEA